MVNQRPQPLTNTSVARLPAARAGFWCPMAHSIEIDRRFWACRSLIAEQSPSGAPPQTLEPIARASWPRSKLQGFGLENREKMRPINKERIKEFGVRSASEPRKGGFCKMYASLGCGALSATFGCSATLGITTVQMGNSGRENSNSGPEMCTPLFLRPKSKPAGREKPARVAAIRVATKYPTHVLQ